MKNKNLGSRREFLRTGALAAAGFSILPSGSILAVNEGKVRLAFIGTGLRGQSHLELALRRDDVEVMALCDVQQRMIDMALGIVATAGAQKPRIILDGPEGYKK